MIFIKSLKQLFIQFDFYIGNNKADASKTLFYPTTHFLKTILIPPLKWHICFCPLTQTQPFAKPKVPFFCHRTENLIFENIKSRD